MRQTGGDALARQLVAEGISHVFGVPGVQLDWAVDGLRKVSDDLRFIVPRHEQATSYMADGYARTRGDVGVCMVVPGPGLLNAMAGLSTAYACNSRVLCICGDIYSQGVGKRYGLLHEVNNQTQILGAVTKWQARANKPEDVPVTISQAMHEARSGRPLPVGIEISHDVLQGSGEIPLAPKAKAAEPAAPDGATVARAAEIIASSKLPVIYVGGGALASKASGALRALAERIQAPVVLGENGRGAISDRHPLALNALAGRAVFAHADTVIVVGSRFVDTAMGRPAWPSEAARYIFINLDPSSWAPPRRADVTIQADCRIGLEALERAVAPRPALAVDLNSVRRWAQEQMVGIEPQGSWVRALREAIPDDGILVNELTQVGYFARLAYPVYEANTFITPGYQGTLGYGFPTAIGAAIGSPDKMVVSINGDGGFGWNVQELATARKYNANVAIIVFNDGHFGNVRTMQQDQFGQEFGVDLLNPHFDRLASAYEIPYVRADQPHELLSALRDHRERRGPTLIEARVLPMPSPWHLLRLIPPPFARGTKPGPNPLGEPAPSGAAS